MSLIKKALLDDMFTKLIPSEYITHINTDGTMTPEEFKYLDTGK